MKIVGIDPGVSATGLVLFETETETFSDPLTLTSKHTDDDSFKALLVRCRETTSSALEYVAKHAPRVVAVESYEDIPPLRGASRRYYTPVLLGMLDVALDGWVVVYQSPLAKRHWADYKTVWAGRGGIFRGDKLLTNDHLRDAAIHCLILRSGGESVWSG